MHEDKYARIKIGMNNESARLTLVVVSVAKRDLNERGERRGRLLDRVRADKDYATKLQRCAKMISDLGASQEPDPRTHRSNNAMPWDSRPHWIWTNQEESAADGAHDTTTLLRVVRCRREESSIVTPRPIENLLARARRPLRRGKIVVFASPPIPLLVLRHTLPPTSLIPHAPDIQRTLQPFPRTSACQNTHHARHGGGGTSGDVATARR
ncbi:hypothetical protein B0H13DRAFT_2073014 [Mycena leptocephala]|nr:hypothetical protein B0H13DRAFT_2073014 [Mycena leptocephala]